MHKAVLKINFEQKDIKTKTAKFYQIVSGNFKKMKNYAIKRSTRILDFNPVFGNSIKCV